MMASTPSASSNIDPSAANPTGATIERPSGVTVFAILNVLFGLMGILGAIFTFGLMMLSNRIDLGPNPVFDLMRDDATYQTFSIVMGVIGLGFAALLLASGIGLLKMRPWARTSALVYAVYAIIAVVVSNVVNYYFIFQPIMRKAVDQAEMNDGGQDLAMVAGMLGGILGGCVSLILPVAILIYFLRPSIKAKF